MGTILILALGVSIISIILNGFALSVLWGWFVAPAFGLPELSVGYAMGIAVLIDMLNPTSQKPDSIEAVIANAVLRPIFTLIFGWLILQFV